MTRIMMVLTLLAGTVVPTTGHAQDPYVPSPFGADVQVSMLGIEPVTGELIAVSDDSLWVLDGRALHTLPLARVQVRLRRFASHSDGAWAWGLLGGIATGAGMMGACTSAEADGCGGVFVAMLLPWLGWGAAGAATLASSSVVTVPHFPEFLRPYARFPQGLPPGVDEAALRGGSATAQPF